MAREQPAPISAEVKKTKDSIVFRETRDGKRIEYVFGGAEGLLLEKRCGRRRIRYYEYAEKAGKRFPGGIILENRKYHYRLVLRLKEVL